VDMITIQDIQKWIHEVMRKWGEAPKTIPISKVEVMELVRDYGYHYQVQQAYSSTPRMFGIGVEEVDYAESLRSRRLEVPVSQFIHEYELDNAIINNTEIIRQEWLHKYFCDVKLWCLSDKTRLEVTFEWDCFAHIKRLLHITRWFPIKTKSSTIDCLILYPYCKVQFPHNKQTLKFSLSK